MFLSSVEKKNWKIFKKIDSISTLEDLRGAMDPADQIFLDIVAK